ncbi:helix-turn-helix domain-containing protein [Weissella confusa]|uniref:helix-turn-helix domain-containing protein n=1 Tax=Weissella confusa TaxID=1583 RepID=UPI0010822E2C|nr:helix-turn-helix transcriptional regulator [Weissella confusa]MBD5832702.1 XRE family transcriptional regulator [Weissella confusa]MBJ7635356.1 helix-turn-helix transcriptional regulator [Weissella confusa]TGE42750.1 XRE family transcriptional regulator [Weissella confusa]
MTLFERVKELSKKRGYSLAETSQKAGLGQRALYQWKDNQPSADRLKAVADVLGVSVDYLLGNTDQMYGNKKDDMPIDLEETLSKLGPAVSFGGKELTDEQKLKFYEMAKLMFGE